ncbi:hypothetical protein [Halostella salina]|uniref:hypothetical protein n=1 Tax=Halostella salina TaxID=1547897 RepID=UPI000EF79AA6|nr:hypothetical protein [Halostella salina]
MNLDELRSVQSKERQKDSLQHLRDSFYADVGQYIADLKAQRDRAAEEADDPFSDPEVGRLTDEIETAEEVVESVYERRMGKIVKRASIAAAGMQSDEEGLTTEEKDLYADIVDRIEANKGVVLDTLSGEETSESTEEPPTETEPTQSSDGVAAADLMGDGTEAASDDDAVPDPVPETGDAVPEPIAEAEKERADESNDTSTPTPSPEATTETDGGAVADDGDTSSQDEATAPAGAPSGTDRSTVRITEDVGQILGVDEREYELAAEDVVSLPDQNVDPLIQQDAAERLD